MVEVVVEGGLDRISEWIGSHQAHWAEETQAQAHGQASSRHENSLAQMKLGYKVVQVSTLVHTTIICLPDFARGSELVPLFPDFHPCSVFPAQHPQRSYYSADAPNPPFSYCKRRSFSGDLEAPFLTHFLSDPFGVLIFGLFLLSSLSQFSSLKVHMVHLSSYMVLQTLPKHI